MLHNELLLKIFRSNVILFAKSKLLCTKILDDQELLQTNILKSLTNEEFKQICLFDKYSIIEFYNNNDDKLIHVKPYNSDDKKIELICINTLLDEYRVALSGYCFYPLDDIKILIDKIKQCSVVYYDVDLSSLLL